MKKSTLGIMVAVAVVLIGAAIWYAGEAAEKANEGVVLRDNIKGNPESQVVLTEFSDFQCPACAAAAPVVAELLDMYGDQMQFEYRHFPLIQIHPHARSAAIAAEAAGVQGKFFEFHDLLFENQSVWSAAPAPQTYYIQYAEELGLDTGQFRRHLRSSLIEDKVMGDLNEARTLGLGSTPSFLLNGELVQLQSYDDLRIAIERAIGVPTGGAADEVETASEPVTSDVRFGF